MKNWKNDMDKLLKKLYGSDAANRKIYLHQAKFSTGLMRWFEKNIDKLSNALAAELHEVYHE